MKKVYNKIVLELNLAAVLTVLAALTVSAGIQSRYSVWQLSVDRSYRTAGLTNEANAPSACTIGGAEAVDKKWCSLDTTINRAECLQVLFLRLTSQKHVCMYVCIPERWVNAGSPVRMNQRQHNPELGLHTWRQRGQRRRLGRRPVNTHTLCRYVHSGKGAEIQTCL